MALQLDEYIAILDPYWIRPDVSRQWLTDRLSRAHVELARVQRTFNFMAVKKAIAQPRMTVGADDIGTQCLTRSPIQG
jgi:hypothetical protein